MRNSIILKASICILVFAVLVAPATTFSQFGKKRINPDRIVLITDDEFAQPNQKLSKGLFGDKEPSDGPTIEFDAPTPESEVEKPVPIRIKFLVNQAPVDISSLEVTYLKLFSIDITDRVKPYATLSGINIEQADLPVGSHKVKFSIRDTENRLTERTLKIKII